MGVVKVGMNYGDLFLEFYFQVWEECYFQVFYFFFQNRYIRVNLVSKKDRIEFFDKRLEVGKNYMFLWYLLVYDVRVFIKVYQSFIEFL